LYAAENMKFVLFHYIAEDVLLEAEPKRLIY